MWSLSWLCGPGSPLRVFVRLCWFGILWCSWLAKHFTQQQIVDYYKKNIIEPYETRGCLLSCNKPRHVRIIWCDSTNLDVRAVFSDGKVNLLAGQTLRFMGASAASPAEIQVKQVFKWIRVADWARNRTKYPWLFWVKVEKGHGDGRLTHR